MPHDVFVGIASFTVSTVDLAHLSAEVLGHKHLQLRKSHASERLTFMFLVGPISSILSILFLRSCASSAQQVSKQRAPTNSPDSCSVISFGWQTAMTAGIDFFDLQGGHWTQFV